MDSFDRSLKHLLARAPDDLLGFGLGQKVHVVRPVSTTLAGRGREVDGCYLIEEDGKRRIVHLEFHRRHQNREHLAMEIAEAQIRLYRRERLPITTLLWDLYGTPKQVRLTGHETVIGPDGPRLRCRYHRVNLRAMTYVELLAQGPPSLWPLVALTRDGRHPEALRQTCQAIESRGLPPDDLADQWAVMWLVAESEQVPIDSLKNLLLQENIMPSTLYEQILADGEARGIVLGEARGEARGIVLGEERGEIRGQTKQKMDAIVRVLTARLGVSDLTVRRRVEAQTDDTLLSAWYAEALLCTNARSAQNLVNKIRSAPLPPPSKKRAKPHAPSPSSPL